MCVCVSVCMMWSVFVSVQWLCDVCLCALHGPPISTLGSSIPVRNLVALSTSSLGLGPGPCAVYRTYFNVVVSDLS